MKRAAIIITEGATFWVQTIMKARHRVVASEQLLADLQMLAYLAADDGDLSDVPAEEWREIAARVRALLPKEGDKDE